MLFPPRKPVAHTRKPPRMGMRPPCARSAANRRRVPDHLSFLVFLCQKSGKMSSPAARHPKQTHLLRRKPAVPRCSGGGGCSSWPRCPAAGSLWLALRPEHRKNTLKRAAVSGRKSRGCSAHMPLRASAGTPRPLFLPPSMLSRPHGGNQRVHVQDNTL